MTRQFFRKADAAVVVYDVTNETSYLNARQWLDSARDAIQLPGDAETSQAEFLLLGNKADLAEDDIKRCKVILLFDTNQLNSKT
jgi:GTPase SAR1 family protein